MDKEAIKKEIKEELEEHFHSEFASLREKLDEMSEQLKPINELYQGSKFTWAGVVGVFKLLAVVGAGVTAFVYIKKLITATH